ncbi:hypothetical protein SBA2_30073 [Acidobacteriia bacterium SbA2]|nr:hypothetical protein SBA2_30073 [Acidobacteriia bacterium SbA2]
MYNAASRSQGAGTYWKGTQGYDSTMLRSRLAAIRLVLGWFHERNFKRHSEGRGFSPDVYGCRVRWAFRP